MKLALPTLILLLIWHTPLPGQVNDSQDARAGELMRRGKDAMTSRLWELARHHYLTLLNQPDLGEKHRMEASMRLAEAMIRDGEPDAAIELLDQSFLADHPETSFWKGQALAANGRFAQAVEILKARMNQETSPALPYRLESGLTAASIELALDLPQEALKTLTLTSSGLKTVDRQRIRLRQINILLDLGRIEEARELMPARQEVNSALQSDYAFTNAAILLREKKHEQAAKSYQELVENPQNLSLRQHHESWIGWSDALLAQGKSEEAAELLLDYVQKFPESSQLEEIFKRLLSALPEEPAPSDRIITRLEAWIQPAELPELGLIPDRDCLAVSAWPQPTQLNDLSVFALYTRAVGLHRQNTPATLHQSEVSLKRLLLEAPTHFLANRALLLKARWHLEAKEIDEAHHLLDTIRETATSPLVKGRAAFQQALSIAGSGGKATEAAELYQQAAQLLQGVEADTALFNGALIHLIQADAIPEDNPAKTIQDPIIAANLTLERALANTDPTRKQIAIEAFLLEHPNHPRAPEARINAAESALLNQPPDLSSARAQIDALMAVPENQASVTPARLAMVKLRVLDLEGSSQEAITSARTLIADFPASTQAVEASFILGRNLYETGNYNDARIALEKLTGSLSDSHRIQTAWLLAARSAALIPTNQSQQEALGLFDKAIAIEGPLRNLARLEKARLMIDMNLLNETVAYLKPWHEKLEAKNPLRLSTGLLLAEAIYAQGKLNPDSLPQALSIYDQLVANTERFSPEHDRLQYLRGLTLEQLPDPQFPDQNRDKEALIAYYSVLEREQAPAQWEYFEAAGFRALALLEKGRRWPAAIACAKKIASFKGPRAEEAAARANQIQLKYMIWED
jgi:TolA-binding protein